MSILAIQRIVSCHHESHPESAVHLSKVNAEAWPPQAKLDLSRYKTLQTEQTLTQKTTSTVSCYWMLRLPDKFTAKPEQRDLMQPKTVSTFITATGVTAHNAT